MLGLSIMEMDQRGLLFDADPFAFAAQEPNDGAAPSVITVRGLFSDGAPRRFATRSTASRPAFQRLGSNVGAFPDNGLGGPVGSPAASSDSPILTVPSPLGRNDGIVPGPGAPVTGSPGAPFIGGSVPGGSFGGSPIGAFVPIAAGPGPGPGAGGTPPPPPIPPGTTPTDPAPVVPAIPEPSTWLLMILGIGWLGVMLRRRAEADASPSPSATIPAV